MASITVDVDLDEFSESEILEAALEIVQDARKGKPSASTAKLIESLRLEFGAPEPEEREPLSTAAKLATYRDLQSLIENNPGMYHFAGVDA